MVICPHCQKHKIFTSKVPKDMIVVLPCPACNELVVLFQNRVLAVSRKILEHGTFEERKMHFAELIAQFFEQGPSFEEMAQEAAQEADEDAEAPRADRMEFGELLRRAFHRHGGPVQVGPITQEELDQFVRVELRRIDDPDYFKKNLN
jgi:hypothetical protein